MQKEPKFKKLRTRGHRVVLNRSKGGDGAITVLLFIAGFVMILPLVYTISQSLKPLNELFIFPPRFLPMKPTLENFKGLFYLMNFSWVPFSRYVFNTVFISFAGTFGNLLLSSLAAYALAKIDFPGRNFFFQIVQKSLMFSTSITGTIVYLIVAWLGWMDSYVAVIVPAFASSIGLYLMKQFMESNVTTAILESARLDGAKEFKIFWSIAMPMVKPAWLTLIMTSFQGLWQMGGSSYIYSEQLKTINYAIGQMTAVGVARTGVAAAGTVFIMIVPIIVFVVSQSNIIETMGSSGMKD
ncbi:MAG: carbohydrate ABC transporter permease [Clostridia bacterium]|nr:carbohydrate ABC transporter permease [Clostridia bacterium]